MTAWVKMAADLDSNPKICKAGHLGTSVFLFALRRYGTRYDPTEKPDDGIIPSVDLAPTFVSRMLGMSEAEATAGVEAAIASGLLHRDGDNIAIVGHKSTVWKRDPTNAERQKRHRNALRNGVTSVTSNGHALVTPRSEEIRSEEIREDQNREIPPKSREGALSPEDPGDVSISVSDSIGRTIPEASWLARGARDAREPEQEAPPTRKGAQKANQGRSQQSTGAVPIRTAIPEPLPPPEAEQLAASLFHYVIKNDPNSRLARAPEVQQEATRHRWGHEIRRMNSIDLRGYSEIWSMIHWSQAHPFWKVAILSAESLREKWDTMAAQKKRPKPGDPPVADPAVERERAAARKLEQEKQSAIERARADQVAADRDEVTAGLAEVKQKLGIVP